MSGARATALVIVAARFSRVARFSSFAALARVELVAPAPRRAPARAVAEPAIALSPLVTGIATTDGTAMASRIGLKTLKWGSLASRCSLLHPSVRHESARW